MTGSSNLTKSIVNELDRSGLSIKPGYLEPDLLGNLLDETRALKDGGDFRQAGVGRGESWHVNPEIRSDFVHWIDPTPLLPAQKEIQDRYEELRMAINEQLFLGIFAWEGHLTLYPPGAHYARHLDRFRDAMHRTVSTILYLNEDWSEGDGGQLRIYTGKEAGEQIDVLPLGGTLVTFLSERFEHEVLPSARERISLTGWFAQRR